MVYNSLTEEQQLKVQELEGIKDETIVIDNIEREVQVENDFYIVIEQIRQYVGKARKAYEYYYIIMCKECGYIKKVSKSNFATTTACRNCKDIKYKKDFVGYENQAYIVLEFVRKCKWGTLYYLCRCKNCGTELVIRKDHILSSKSFTCVKCKGNGKPATLKSPINVYRNVYLNNAKVRGINWELSEEQFETLIFQNCQYCGAIPQERAALKRSTRTKEPLLVNGIDRLDPNLGYTLENCIPCCSMCNKMKMDYDYPTFISQISRIYNNHVEKLISDI